MHVSGRRLVTLAICTPIVSALSVACSGGPAPVAADCIKVVSESGERTDECLPVAPDSERIDLATPKFSHPTPITNPLHPTSRVEQVIFGVMIIMFLIFEPLGLARLWQLTKERLRLWPFKH